MSRLDSFSRTLLSAALITALAPAAHAVERSADGRGQVLLYPYYTTNGGNQTLLSVVNTTNRTKAVRVRFNESRNGREVRAFNVYLGPFDVWTGAVVAESSGAARFVTVDTTCTVPTLPAGGTTFSNTQYTGPQRDHPESLAATLSSAERTREGFIEMIEMGLLRTGPGSTQLAEEATAFNNTPINCNALVNAFGTGGGWFSNAAADIDLPNGGLYGFGAIVDVADGSMLAYSAEALEDFYTDAATPGALHADPAAPRPRLADAANGGGVAVASTVAVTAGAPSGTRVSESFTVGTRADAVSFALLAESVLNEYTNESALGAVTEWVVTFPTKRDYTDVASNGTVTAPFVNAFRDDGRAPVEFFYAHADRQGRRFTSNDEIIGTPPPDYDRRNVLDNVANVVFFVPPAVSQAPSPILGATSGATAVAGNFVTPPYASGQTMLRVPASAPPFVTGQFVSYVGYPMIGFSAWRIVNSNALPGVLANFADAFPHTFMAPRQTTSPAEP